MNQHLQSFVTGNIVNLSVAVTGVILLGLGAVFGYQAWQSQRAIAGMEQTNAAVDSLLNATQLQARERGFTAGLIGTEGPVGLIADLQSLRQQVDLAWNDVFARIHDLGVRLDEDASALDREQRLRSNLDAKHAMRERVDDFLLTRGEPVHLDEWFGLATEVNAAAASLRRELTLVDTDSTETARLNLLIRENGARVAEHYGQMRGLVNFHVSSGQPMPPEQIEMAWLNSRMARSHFLELVEAADGISELSDQIGLLQAGHSRLIDTVERVLEDASRGEYHLSASRWWEVTTDHINDIFDLLMATSDLAVGQLQDRARRQLIALGSYLALALLAIGLAGFSLRRVHRNAETVFLQKEMSEKILDSIADAVIAVDAAGRIIHLNPIAEDLTGWPFHEAHLKPYDEVFRIHNHLNTSHSDPIGTCLEQGMVIVHSEGHVLIDRAGNEVPVENSCAPIRNRRHKIVGAVVIFSSKETEGDSDRILTYHATRDALTSVFNRREFERRLQDLCRHARETGEHHTLAFIDLDHFKAVNDTAGHAAGDQMLRQIAWLMGRNIRDTDTLARLGGDEFGLLLKKCNVEHARAVAAKLQRAIRELRFPWQGQSFQVGASIGLVEITPDSPEFNELIREADAACYAAKDRGRNHIHVYKPDDLKLAAQQGRMRWVTRLAQALDENRFELFGQCIHPLRDQLPLQVEILLRLRDADGTLIAPGAFIPAAERHGMMPDIDQWVVEHACRQLPRLMSEHPEVVFSINLSGTTMSDPDRNDELARIIRYHGLAPGRLYFEITETAAVSSLDTTITIIERMHQHGFRFALDDFGTGLSSLGSLKDLPIDQVKIDGTFIRNLRDDPVASAMVEAMARIAKLLDIATVAEFVEVESIVERLRAIGIDYAQGFHFSKPRPLNHCLDE